MTNQKLNSIIFNGVEGEAFGGSIFSFRIESNGIESPPKYIVSVVYPPTASSRNPAAELNAAATITVGGNGLGGSMKLFGVSYEDNPEYTTAHFTYLDGSSFLDTTYVGINYRHGVCARSTYCGSIEKGMIILGGEIQGVEEEKECINCEDQVEKIVGQVAALSCDNKDSGYSVDDFIAACKNHIIDISLLSRAGDATLSYTGTLREVLSSICSDAGATFMTDYKGKVKIIDGSQGIQINDAGLANDPNVKKRTYESSRDGTYKQYGSSFSLKPTRSLSQTRENYTQFTLQPVNAALTLDVQLGAISMRGPMWRDQICRQEGLYSRLGFYGGLYSVNPTAGAFQNNMSALADCMQDSSLLDLVNQGFTYWNLTRFSDELKNYYINAESAAIQEYGILYKASITRPASTEEKNCISNEFRKITTSEFYPDIDAGGFWRKNISAKDISPSKIDDLGSYYAPVIVPLIGELAEKYSQCTNNYNSSAFGGDFTNAAFVAWKSNVPGVSVQSSSCLHPDEELKRAVNQKDTYCLLPCEDQQQDACQILNQSCSKGAAGIFQGSEGNIGYCLGGIVLPSTSTFWGWYKKTDDMSKSVAGELKINGALVDPNKDIIPELDRGDVQSLRYSLTDLSAGGGNAQVSSFHAISENRTYEIIGEYVPTIDPSLKSWSMSIDGNGVFTNISYQNRPPIPSKQDTSISKVTPRKILLRS